MTTVCGESIGNNFCSCIGTDNPDYIQYNADGLSKGQGAGNTCCNLISYTPDILHKLPGDTSKSEIGSTSSFLNLFTQLEFTPCDYTKYFGGNTVGSSDADAYLKNNYYQLFNFAERQRIIYNNFYVYKSTRYPSSVTGNSDLVPVISGNTVSTPVGTTPLILSYYDGVHTESQYLFIVWTTGKDLPKLNFPYKTYYFYDNNEEDCKNNYCTTQFSPHRGISFSSKGPGNNGQILSSPPVTNIDTTTLIILIIIVLSIVFISLLVYYGKNYPKRNSLIKNG